MTSEALAGLFSTDEGVNDFMSWLKEDSGYSKAEKKTVLRRIVDFFDRIIEAIKETIQNGELSKTAREFAQMQADKAAEIREMFLEALDGINGKKRESAGSETKDSRKKSYVSRDGHFLSYRETGGSDAHEQALRWSARDSVKDGDKKLAYCNGSWYIIIKDLSDLEGYQVGKKINGEKYERKEREIREYNRKRHESDMVQQVDEYHSDYKRSNSSSNGGYGSDVNGSEYKTKGGQVRSVDRATSQREKTRIGSGQNTFGSNENWGRTGTERLTDSEVKNSLKLTDSEGNELSEEQRKFFENSKVRDEDGNLLVVYHGTDADFTVFDRTKGRSSMDIQGSFFSPWELDASGYGADVKAYYLDIKNPASEGVAYKALNKFKGQNYAGVKAREYLESLGYDGVNNSGEEYIAFNPQQIKSIDNLNPTDNPDIRYSLRQSLGITNEGDSNSSLLSQNEEYRKLISELQTQLGKRHFVDAKKVQTLARVIKEDYRSTIRTDELSAMLGDFYDSVANNKGLSWDVVRIKTREIAEAVVSKSKNSFCNFSFNPRSLYKGAT